MENAHHNLKFQFHFDEALFKEHTTLNWDTAWVTNIKKVKTNFIFTLLAGVLAGLFIYDYNPLGYAMLGICFYSLIIIINYYFMYKKKKKTYDTAVLSEIDSFINDNETIVWEFKPDAFYYKDHRIETTIKWTVFKGYRLIDSKLFLDFSEGLHSSYILAESEVGKEVFDRIVSFVKERIEESSKQ